MLVAYFSLGLHLFLCGLRLFWRRLAPRLRALRRVCKEVLQQAQHVHRRRRQPGLLLAAASDQRSPLQRSTCFSMTTCESHWVDAHEAHRISACARPPDIQGRAYRRSSAMRARHKLTFGRGPAGSAGAVPCSPLRSGCPTVAWTSAPTAAGWTAGPGAAAAAALGRLMAVSRAAATSRAAACGPRPPEPLRWPAAATRPLAKAARCSSRNPQFLEPSARGKTGLRRGTPCNTLPITATCTCPAGGQ